MGTASPFGSAFWLLLAVAGMWVAVPLVFGLALVWWTTRKRAGAGRRARLIGLGAGALIGILAAFAAQLWLAPIAVVAGYLAAVCTDELRGSSVPAGEVRTASLQPRTVRRYVPRWAMVVAIVAAALTMLAPAILSAVPTASYGPWHPFPDVTVPGGTLSWPPARDWIPLGVVAGGALLIGALLVQRVLRLPADRSDPRESGRRATVRTITATVVGIELLALGALTLFASSGLAVPEEVGGAAYVVSRVLVWTGLGLAAAGIVLWWALSARRRGRLAPDAVPQS
ncbi:MAG TPA: hypothetical protein VGG05_21215 [Pseudonocardiaceae bacterium]|jgi:hypothetical protein